MTYFKRFYLWGMNTKFFMGLYFAAMVFLVGILTAILGSSSINLMVLLQIFLVAFVIAVVQSLLLPDSVSFLHGIFISRSIIWLIFSGALTGVAAHLGSWFSNAPKWCPWLLAVFMIAGCIAMLVGIRFEQESDTIRLNKSLQSFQQRKQ